MASPGESKFDENEVTSQPQHIRGGEVLDGDGDDQVMDLDFPLMQQPSIFSLTFDGLQDAVCEPGKSFGSVNNMDEFIDNIWSAGEGFGTNTSTAISTDSVAAPANATNGGGGISAGADAGGCPPPHQLQGPMTMPGLLTVDEVWAEIHKGVQEVGRNAGRGACSGGANGGINGQHETTSGEITLEDFLKNAGVVQKSPEPAPAPALPHPPAGCPMAQGYGTGGNGFGHVVCPTGYECHSHCHHHHHCVVVSEGHRMRYGNGCGCGMQEAVRVGSPVSPVLSGGVQVVDNMGYGVGGGGGGIEGNGTGRMNGRKRMADGAAVEKVVERRQRRMIKNRESAARSRARKQAYTVELEVELEMLREENSLLREQERRAQALRNQMIAECMAEQAQQNANKALRTLRRCVSAPW